MSADRHGIGGNNPPPEEAIFRAALDAKFEALDERLVDLTLEAASVPKEVTSDDDVVKVNEWVVKARALRRDIERFHDDEKAEYLKRGRWVDQYTAPLVSDLNARALDLEQRNAPYLDAKRAAEEKTRREAAEKAAQEAREKREAAEAAAEAQRKAKEEADAAAKRLAEAKTAEEAEAATLDLRDAKADLQDAAKAEKVAVADVGKAEKVAAREERAAERGGLEKTRGGGGSAAVSVVRRWRWSGPVKTKASLGPLGDYFTQDEVIKAIEKAMRQTPQPAIPGVEWYEETVSKTNATRT